MKQMRRRMVEGESFKFDYFPPLNVGCSIEKAISMKHRILRSSPELWVLSLREDIQTRKTFQFGHCPKVGAVTLARIFWTPFLTN